MREILFRGKMLDGQWVYGSLVKQVYTPQGKEPLTTFWINEESGMSWKVDPNTVGQYTGLKDKNGNKIFEGDIVIYQNKPFTVIWFQTVAGYGWHLEMIDSKESFPPFAVLEVIGNIHDKK